MKSEDDNEYDSVSCDSFKFVKDSAVYRVHECSRQIPDKGTHRHGGTINIAILLLGGIGRYETDR